MTPATQPVPVTVSPAVLALAAERGVTGILPRVLEMTRRVFPRGSLEVLLDEDPEIAEDHHIVVAVTAPGMPVDQALEARYRWHRELFACCPAPLVPVFRLGLELGR